MVGPRSSRALWPREHGAYFQLAIPLAAALAARAPSLPAVAWAAASCLAFLAHEPLLVMIGHRGRRRQRSDGSRARLRLAVLGAAAAVLGAVALALVRPAAISVLAVSLVPVAAVVALAWRRDERTVIGELVAAIALTGASAPVVVASGGTAATAFAIWLGWAVGFGAGVIAVHRVMARHKHPATSADRALAAVLVAMATACAVMATRSPAPLIAAPLVSIAALLVIAPPSASRLRAIGIAIAVTAATSALLALAMQTGHIGSPGR
jgi:hypothetical protein